MNRSFLKKWTCFALVLLMVTAIVPALMFSSSAAESTASFGFSAQNYANQTAITTVNLDSNITATFDKGTNSNAPKYYTNGNAVRLYGGGTLTITATAGYNITKIKITFGSSDSSNEITADVGTLANGSWTGSASNVVFTVGGTSGNRRIQALEVIYESTSGHTHDYSWDGNEGADGNHTLTCANTDGKCEALTDTEACTWVDGACSVCSAIEPTFDIMFSVPTGLTAPASVACPTAGVTLPELPAADGYTAIGWAEAAIVGSSDVEPTTYAAGATYKTTNATTLYAVYALVEETAGAIVYKPVTEKLDDWSGSYIIVNSDKTYAMSPTFKSGTSGEFLGSAIIISNNQISNPAEELIWVLTSDSNNGYYIMNNSTGTYAKITGTNSTNATLTTSEDDSFNIESSSNDGIWKISSKANAARCFAFYSNNNSFRTYAKSNNNTGYLFKATTGISTTYTYYTSFETHICADNLTATEAVSAGCTTDGNSAYWTCECGKFYADAAATTEIEANSWVIPATGHTLVNGVCSVCNADFNYTIPEALTAADGTKVVVSGTVSFINEDNWTQYNNMNVTIKDSNGNELYIYRLATKVELGDIITVTGTMGTYGGARQIAQGATAVITGHEEVEVVYDEVTIPEAIASDDGRLVTFSGTVTAMSYNTVTVSDAEGNTINLYKLATEVALYDIITVKGMVDTYNNSKQIASATAEITGSIAPKITSVSLTLNKGVKVNVTYNISAEWLALNTGAEVVFSNGEKFAAVAGVNTYSVQLTPGQIGDALKVGINEATIEVSVAKYTEKVKASNAAAMSISDAQYTALVTLLDKIIAYGTAAKATGGSLVEESFADVGNETINNENGILGEISATLGEQANIKYAVDNSSIPDATVVVTLNGAEIANGKLTSYLNSDNKLVINGLAPVNFDEVVVITITNAEGTVVADATFTFNQFLKTLYTTYKNDVVTANLAVAAYQYGLAAEAFETAK